MCAANNNFSGITTMDPDFYIHDLDKSALSALKAIPGFTQITKVFMKNWDEKLFNISNMSSNLRISEKQLPKYHNMLLPVCEKLGIEIPDLYLKLDGDPNAYTYGDANPFIVMTSGLLETLPEELLPTILAHECGHIACHHTLYRTMGNLILGGASDLINTSVLGDIAMIPIKAAFAHWMRCSEYSADRAAIVCDGNADKMVEVCMRFSGLESDIAADANIDAFMEQAVEYKELVGDSKTNKAMELLMFMNNNHPLNAVRAYEINEWQKSESFTDMKIYLDSEDATTCEKLPLTNVTGYVEKDYQTVENELGKVGFTNIELTRKTAADSKKNKPSQVVEIAINGKTKFEDADWYSRDSIIEVSYYLPESNEEIIAAHPGQIQIPNSSKGYNGKNCNDIVTELQGLGFTDISTFEQQGPKIAWPRKDFSIARITINGESQFDKDAWFESDATIRITYNIFSK